MGTDPTNNGGQTELSPVFPGQVPSYLGLTCGERPLARFDSAVARPRLKATGDPEDDEEEEEEKKKKSEDDEEKEENDGEDDEVPLQLLIFAEMVCQRFPQGSIKTASPQRLLSGLSPKNLRQATAVRKALAHPG